MIATLPLAACATTNQRPPPLASSLPPAPKLITKAPPLPRLDTVCSFPWFGVSGCKGKDVRAVLRLAWRRARLVRKRAQELQRGKVGAMTIQRDELEEALGKTVRKEIASLLNLFGIEEGDHRKYGRTSPICAAGARARSRFRATR